MKVGLTGVTAEPSTSGYAVALRAIANPRLMLAAAIYVLVFGIYLVLLSRMDVSQAFPTTIGANILFIAIMAIVILGEAATIPRLSGMAMIAVGIYLCRPLLSGNGTGATV